MSKPLLRLSGRRSSGEGRAGATRGTRGDPGSGAALTPVHLPPAGRCPEGTEQNRVRNKLKRLIAKRPPLQSLQERGLLRGEWTPRPPACPCNVSAKRLFGPDLGISSLRG